MGKLVFESLTHPQSHQQCIIKSPLILNWWFVCKRFFFIHIFFAELDLPCQELRLTEILRQLHYYNMETLSILFIMFEALGNIEWCSIIAFWLKSIHTKHSYYLFGGFKRWNELVVCGCPLFAVGDQGRIMGGFEKILCN